MIPTTKAQGRTGSAVKTKVLEWSADYVQSKTRGTQLTLEELPNFLSTRLEDLENTKSYRRDGHVWFYLGTVGTDMDGPYRFDQEARTLQEMFKPVTETEYDLLPFSERARFWAGDKPLSVHLWLNPLVDGKRLGIDGVDSPLHLAPVVVVKQQVRADPAVEIQDKLTRIVRDGNKYTPELGDYTC
jgi:hypothetical protein